MNDLANETTQPAATGTPGEPGTEPATGSDGGPAGVTPSGHVKKSGAKKRAKRKGRRRLAKVLLYSGVVLLGVLAIAEPWLLLPVALIVAGLILA